MPNDIAIAEQPLTGYFAQPLCRPEKGRSLGATVQHFGKHVRLAVGALRQGCRDEVATEADLLSVPQPSLGASYESAVDRYSWFGVNIALLHAVSRGAQTVGSLTTALEWFFGDRQLGSQFRALFDSGAARAADDALAHVQLSRAFLDLLPYILEPHGHVSRAELEAGGVAVETRNKKRRTGVFYTPADVAEFMVESLAGAAVADARWLDPACGTGIFLRTCIRMYRQGAIRARASSGFDYCKENLFGFDISAIANDSCGFVLLCECAAHGELSQIGAYAAWRALRANLITCDAMRVARQSTAANLTFAESGGASDASVELGEVCPKLVGGADVVVMNPPYSTVRIDAALRQNWRSYSQLDVDTSGNTCCAFSEMLWRFAAEHEHVASAAVLPLSVGVSRVQQYSSCREAIQHSGGLWEFLFFDREPHALFGEDIKTRNVIALRFGSRDPTRLRTSGLLKWTSAVRPTIFTRNRAVEIEDTSISRFIPKLGTANEAAIYRKVYSAARVSSAIPLHVTRADAADARRPSGAGATLLVASTAYNFLNCFRHDGLVDVPIDDLSSSPINVFTFPSPCLRDAAFALLSSRLAYWLWHVEADGFHVTAQFLTNLPLWRLSFDDSQMSRLSDLGQAMWALALDTRLRSLNKGKATYSFHCPFASAPALATEALLMELLDLPPLCMADLEAFEARTVSIDGSNRKRN